jgi:hypothetical protein
MRTYPFLYVDSNYVSEYYPWFCELGYPMLDMGQDPDGEWWIVEMTNAPLIPSMTCCQAVLTGLRNVEKSKSFLEKYLRLIDPWHGAFWDREDGKTAEAEKRVEDKEKHFEASNAAKLEAIKRNPELVERFVKYGPKALDFGNLWNNLTPYQKRRMGNVNRQFFAPC